MTTNAFKLLVSEYWPDGSVKYREWADGLKCWYKRGVYGLLHRVNGAAMISNTSKVYFLNGKIFNNIKNDEEWIIKQIIK